MNIKVKHLKLSSKVILLSILPSILIAIIITTISLREIRTGMTSATLSGLTGIAESITASLQEIDPGDYSSKDGIVYKGDYLLTNNNVLSDNIQKLSGIDTAIFYDELVVSTSLVNPDTGNRLIGEPVYDPLAKQALTTGRSCSNPSLPIFDKTYLSYYTPLVNSNQEPVGILFVAMDNTMLTTQLRTTFSRITLTITGCLLIVLLFTFLFGRSIAKLFAVVQHTIESLADGNLKPTLPDSLSKRTDEIGVILGDIDDLSTKWHRIIETVKTTSTSLQQSGDALAHMSTNSADTSSNITQVVTTITVGITEQANDVQETNQLVEVMGDNIEKISSSVEEITSITASMDDSRKSATKQFHSLATSNDAMQQSITYIDQQILATNNAIKNIGKTLDMITNISRQTNLLALNASIEAARAGDAGHGFAVVASEIQKLADESNQSADKIRHIITDVTAQSNLTLQGMAQVRDYVAKQIDALTHTQDSFTEILAGIQSATLKTQEIADYTHVCNDSRTLVIDKVQSLAAIAEENAASTEETMASMEELNDSISHMAIAAEQLNTIAYHLAQDIAFFK